MDIQSVAKFLINPLIQIQFGLLLLVILLKQNRKFTIAMALYFYIITTGLFGYLFLSVWSVSDTFDENKQYDAVVVLASTSRYSWYVENKDTPYVLPDVFYTADSTERILAGIYFVNSNHAKRLLYGRWMYKGVIDESKRVERFAVELGVKREQFIVYGDVKRTTDEAKKAALYAKKHGFKNLLLVTSTSHMRRARAMFIKQGITPDTFSVNKKMGLIDVTSFMPNSVFVKLTYTCFYELVGYISYYMTGYL